LALPLFVRVLEALLAAVWKSSLLLLARQRRYARGL
jgi:hypothetical protein